MKIGTTQLMFAGAILAAATVVCADTVRMTASNFNSGNGGEFRATTIAGYAGEIDGNGGFQTFCLESNKPIVLDGGQSGSANVYDFQINTAAHSGGYGGPNPDPISANTAYLYTMFRNGTLSNYAFGGTAEERKESARALQIALWTLEEEYGQNPPTVNAQATAWLAEAAAAVANAAIWGNTIGDVRVLTLLKNGEDFQDMLTIIPLPPSAWMGLASLAGVGVLQVRRRVRALATMA